MTASEPGELLGPEEGGGPPGSLMPWTLEVTDEDWSADLEHGAPVPRVGDLVEYIADTGDKRLFRVVRVVHTVQSSSSGRPLVSEERSGPNSTLDEPSDGPPRTLRAGLPRVVVVAAEED
jgi:hypothetical protein